MYEDHASGAAADRPSLTACLDYLRRGDVLVVLDLDRLGRRAGELITLIDELDQRGIGFRALNSPPRAGVSYSGPGPHGRQTARPPSRRPGPSLHASRPGSVPWPL